jgi:hypothetical protein
MPAPSETFATLPFFANLEDRLLRGGIAPRHVKRYLRELTEHLADLTTAQREAGFDEADAAARARAALGPDKELADAMLKQRDFRALAARFPWAVFSVAPPLAMFICNAFPVLLVGAFAKLALVLSLIQKGTVEPAWLQITIRALLDAGNLLALPLAVLLMSVIVWRQRLSPAWLLLSLLVLWPIVLCANIDFPATAEIARKQGASLSFGLGFSTSGGLANAKSLLWPVVHYCLALLPVAWLLKVRRTALAKVPAAG